MRATVKWWTTTPVSAQRTAARESLARGSAAWLMSCATRERTLGTGSGARSHAQSWDATRKARAPSA